jgi:hypothetical protein
MGVQFSPSVPILISILMLYKTIHAVGDSHCRNFSGLSHVICHKFPCRTMYWVTTEDFDKVWNRLCNKYNIDDFWLYGFGEIDARIVIYKQITEKNREEDEVITTLVNAYFNKLTKLHKKIGFVNAMPTWQLYTSGRKVPQLPNYLHHDEDRKRYTLKINETLKLNCDAKNIPYLDLHSLVKDKNGYLKYELSDKRVHLRDFSMIPGLLRQHNLM